MRLPGPLVGITDVDTHVDSGCEPAHGRGSTRAVNECYHDAHVQWWSFSLQLLYVCSILVIDWVHHHTRAVWSDGSPRLYPSKTSQVGWLTASDTRAKEVAVIMSQKAALLCVHFGPTQSPGTLFHVLIINAAMKRNWPSKLEHRPKWKTQSVLTNADKFRRACHPNAHAMQHVFMIT